MTRVSIVVPSYNVEEYVAESIASCLAQTHKDVEVVVVDDGSTDGTDAVIAKLAGTDARIKAIRKENGGLSSARNAGIKAATGEIIMLLDADDLLEPNAAARVARAFAETGCAMATFGARCIPEDAARCWLVASLSPQDAIYENGDQEALYRGDTKPFVWRSAFAKSFLDVNNLRFREDVRFGEDMVFYFEAYPLSPKTAVLSDKLYVYRLQRPGSLMAQRADTRERKVSANIDIVRHVLQAWDERGWIESDGLGLLEWAVEFLSPEMFACKPEEREHLIGETRELLQPYLPRLTKRYGDDMEFGTRQLLERLMDSRPFGNAEATFVIWRYYRHRMGLKFCIDKLRGKYN